MSTVSRKTDAVAGECLQERGDRAFKLGFVELPGIEILMAV
ncbi:hypothetical protein [Laspinema palackyanum]